MALSNSRSVSVSRIGRFPLVQTAAIDLRPPCGPRVRSSTAVLQAPYGGPLRRTLGRDTECSSASQAEPRSSTLSSEKIPWRRVLIGAHVRQIGRSQRSPRLARFLHHGSVITCLPK